MHYVIKNDAAHSLGKAPLPYGKVRIFIEGAGENAEASTAFLGEDWGKFTPKDDEMRLYLGVAQDIVVKRTIERNDMKHVAGNLFNHDVIVKYEIENFKKEPVTLDVVENLRHIRNEIAWRYGPRSRLGTERRHDVRRRARQGAQHCGAVDVSRQAARGGCQRQGGEDHAQAASHVEERMVTSHNEEEEWPQESTTSH